MTTAHRVTGTVPPDSPLTALAGRTITAPVETLNDLLHRVTEMRAARIDPVIQPAPHIPWTPIAGTVTGALLAAVGAALAGILRDDLVLLCSGVGAAALLGGLLFVVLAHLEGDL